MSNSDRARGRDRLIPFAMGEELAKKAGGPVTTLWIDAPNTTTSSTWARSRSIRRS